MFTVPIAEGLIIYLHVHIPVVVIVDALLTLILLSTGLAARFLKAPMAKPWMALIVPYFLAAVLGVYKGASIPFIFEYGIRFHVVGLYCCAVAVKPAQVRSVLRWIGWGMILLVLMCAKFGDVKDGRFYLPDTSLENPNDLALALMFGMPCLALNSSKVMRLVSLAVYPIMLYFILKTGSRASLITVVAMIGTLFMLAPKRAKLLMAVALPVVGAAMVMLVRSETLSRLTLIVADTSNVQVSGQLSGAIGSQEARTELQKRAIQLSLRNPVFGVGALQFTNAVDLMVRETIGVKSGWQGAHNTYLEVAAENGIPALILYVAALVYCFKLNYQTYKVCRADSALEGIAPQSLALLVMTVAFCVCIGFNNDDYDPRAGLLVGLSAANFLAVRDERKALATAVPFASAAVSVQNPMIGPKKSGQKQNQFLARKPGRW